jgi:hypothetical protein
MGIESAIGKGLGLVYHPDDIDLNLTAYRGNQPEIFLGL